MVTGGVPRVLVVLLNYNGWRNTIECLESVLRSDYPEIRVLIVDNGSTDGSRENIRAWAAGDLPAPLPPPALAPLCVPPVRKPVAVAARSRSNLETGGAVDWSRAHVCLVEAGANLGFSAGNNVALQYIQRHEAGSFALLLNNDTLIAPTAIAAMVRAAATPPMLTAGTLTAVGATILQYNAPDRVETFGGNRVTPWHGATSMIGWDAPRRAPRPSVELSYVSGCCLLLPHATLSRVGLLDERFFIYNEDADWGARARAAGVRLIYSAEAEVWHKGSATAVARTPFHDYHNTKSLLHFARKHHPGVFPVTLIYLTARFTLAKLMRGEWSRLGAVRAALSDFLAERKAYGTEVAHGR